MFEMAGTSEEFSVDRHEVGTLCDPCQEDGVSLAAEGFCVDCNDYLCLNCFQNHRTPKPMRHHVLQNRMSMPVSKPSLKQDATPELKCPVHKDQGLLYYCKSHDQVLCDLCQKYDHRLCQKEIHLVKLNGNLFNNGELSQVRARLVQSKTMFQNNKDSSMRMTEFIESSYNQTVTELTDIKNAALELASAVHATCDNMTKELTSINSGFDEPTTKVDNLKLFIAMKMAKSRLGMFEITLARVVNDNRMFTYVFKKNDKTNASGFGALGTIEKCPIKESIHIRTEMDDQASHITGMGILSDDKLVVADNGTGKIKVFDMKNKTVVSELKLQDKPWDLTKIDNSKIAVTASKSKIKVISVSDTGTLNVTKTIPIENLISPSGIVYCNNTLIVPLARVRYNIPGVSIIDSFHILNMNCAVIKTLEIPCFLSTTNMVINQKTNTLYLCQVAKICSVTLDGEVQSIFEDQILIGATGIALAEDGRIFVCTRETHKVYEVSADLDKVQVLFDENHGLSQPCSLAYDSIKHRLFVGGRNNEINIFWL